MTTSLNEYNVAAPLVMPSDDIKKYVTFQNEHGQLAKSLSLDPDKHYSIVLAITDQKFTLEEWITSVTTIKTSLAALSPSIMAIADGAVFECGDYWNPFISVGFSSFRFSSSLDKTSYYSVLIIETDIEVSEESIEQAQTIAGDAVQDRTLDMMICDRLSGSSSTDIKTHLWFEQSADGAKLDFLELIDNNVDIVNKFMAVEVPVSKLDENVPSLYGLDGVDEEENPTYVKWRDWKVFRVSQDENSALLILGTKVGDEAYNYSLPTAQENSLHITQFLKENILVDKQFNERLKSSDYTPETEEGLI